MGHISVDDSSISWCRKYIELERRRWHRTCEEINTEHARKSRPPLEVRIHIFYSSMPESDGSELKRSVISLRREAISICLTNSVKAHCKSRINYRYQGEGVHYGSVTFEPELNRSDSSLGHDSLPIGHFGVVANRFIIHRTIVPELGDQNVVGDQTYTHMDTPSAKNREMRICIFPIWGGDISQYRYCYMFIVVYIVPVNRWSTMD